MGLWPVTLIDWVIDITITLSLFESLQFILVKFNKHLRREWDIVIAILIDSFHQFVRQRWNLLRVTMLFILSHFLCLIKFAKCSHEFFDPLLV